jgi:hypothetical protein
MRDSICARGACTLVVLAATIQISHVNWCHADFPNVYGGPTYSQSTGGYVPTSFFLESPGASSTVFFGIPFPYGAVNDSGVAVGNFESFPAQSSASPSTICVVTWSAISNPVLLDGGSATTAAQALAINDAGTAVGVMTTGITVTSSTVTENHPVSNAAQWNTPATALTTLNGINSQTAQNNYAAEINSLGTAVGSVAKFNSSGVSEGTRAVRWNAGGTNATELGILDANPDAQASAAAFSINSSGTAVGQATLAVSSTEPVRWDASGTTATRLGDLGTPAGKINQGSAVSINDDGTAVGYVTKFDSTGTSLGFRAVRWDAGGTTATELENVGTNNSGFTQCIAVAINSAGITIGDGNKYRGNISDGTRAIRWDAGSTTATELGFISSTPVTFGSDPSSTAIAINSQGIIVGLAQTTMKFGSIVETGPSHAVYWNPDGTAVDLNSLIDPNSGWTLTSAIAISDTGWILGEGVFDPDGTGGQASYQRLFLIQVPEPNSLFLLAIGALAIGTFCKSRKHVKSRASYV